MRIDNFHQPSTRKIVLINLDACRRNKLAILAGHSKMKASKRTRYIYLDAVAQRVHMWTTTCTNRWLDLQLEKKNKTK